MSLRHLLDKLFHLVSVLLRKERGGRIAGGPLTGQSLAIQVVHDLLRGLLVKAIVTQNLYGGCAVVSDLVVDGQSFWDLRLGRPGHHETKRQAIFQTLRAALTLICDEASEGGIIKTAFRTSMLINLRGSIGWAASPTIPMWPLCQIGIGGRYCSGHRLNSGHFLVGGEGEC